MKYDHVTSFLDAHLILLDHGAYVFVSKNEVLYLRDMVWKATRVRQVFQSGMFYGDESVKEE